jgi:hypothetical protein
VYDVRGRRLRAGRIVAGQRVLRWDGRTGGGARVAPGVYFLRIEGMDRTVTTKLVRVAD